MAKASILITFGDIIMKKIVVVFSLVLGVIASASVWSNECKPEDVVGETASAECRVFSADGVVDCR